MAHSRTSIRFPFGPLFLVGLFLVQYGVIIVPAGAADSARAESGSGAVEKARKVILTPEILDKLEKIPGGLGPLGSVPIPRDNPQTAAKIELGKMLFFDRRLSGDYSMSCSTCHDPKKGFSDGYPRAIGFKGKELGRSSPTIINVAFNTSQFWDGRAASLEEQAEKPIETSVEMNLSRAELGERLKSIPEYRNRFFEVFGAEPNIQNTAKAIAAFERTIISTDSRFDRYAGGDKSALTSKEKRGLVLFVSKAACSQCHNGPNFTDNNFYVLGVPQVGPIRDDPGRYGFTLNDSERGAFKTPTLRQVAQSAPYMHNGAFKTLEEVVKFYDRGGGDEGNKSPKILKLGLTEEESSDLVAFLAALTVSMPPMEPPRLP